MFGVVGRVEPLKPQIQLAGHRVPQPRAPAGLLAHLMVGPPVRYLGIFGLPVVPIPGTRSPARPAENAGRARITPTGDEVGRLEPIAARVAGPRYEDMTVTSAGRE